MDKYLEIRKKCFDFCGEISICICFECKEHFYDSCFKTYHNKKLKYNHKNEMIDP